MKKIGKYIGFVCFVFLLSLASAEAKEKSVKVIAEVTSEIQVGEPFRYLIEVQQSNQNEHVPLPTLPNWPEGFEVINKYQSSNSQMTIINGKIERKKIKRFEYQVLPSRTGQFNIAAAKVLVGDQIFSTNAVSLTVKKNTDQKRQPRRNRRNRRFPKEAEDLFKNFFGGNPFRDHLGEGKSHFYIHPRVSKSSVYVGEAIKVEFFIYSQGYVQSIDTLKYPTLDGFWKEDIKVPQRLQFQRIEVKGKRYNRALLVSYYLFPLRAGKLQIDSYEAKVVLSSVFTSSKVSVQKSKPMNITVNPLPQPAPDTFTGGVGKFQVKAQLDASQVKVSEPVLLKVSISGAGHPKNIDLPQWKYPEGLKVYEAKSNMTFKAKKFLGTKSFEVVITPEKPGQYQIKPMKLSFFNPEKKRYETQLTPTLKLKVNPGGAQTGLPSKNFSSEPKEMDSKEMALNLIAPWDFKEDWTSQRVTQWLLVLLGLGVIFNLFVFMKGLFRKGLPGKSEDNLDARWVRVEKFLSESQWRQLGVEVTNAVYWTLGEVASTSHAGEKIDRLIAHLPPSLRHNFELDLKRLIRIFETLSFAPESVVSSVVQNRKIHDSVKELEKILRDCLREGTVE